MKKSKLAVRALIGLLVASLSFPSVLPVYAAPVETSIVQESAAEIENENGYAINEEDGVSVEGEKETRKVKVYYVRPGITVPADALNRRPVLVEVDIDSTTIYANECVDIPSGYQVIKNENGYAINEEGVVLVEVEKETRSLLVYYVDATGAEISRERVQVAEDANMIYVNDLKRIPENYKLADDENYKIDFEAGSTSIKVEVEEKTFVILVNYTNEAGELLGSENVEVTYSTTVLLASDLNAIPAGYELANDTIIFTAGSESVNVVVKAIEIPVENADATLTIKFVTANGEVVGTQTIVKNGSVGDSVRFTKGDLVLPNKYEIVKKFEDIIITYGTETEVNVTVAKISNGGNGSGSSSSGSSSSGSSSSGRGRSDFNVVDVTTNMSGEWVLDATGWWFRYANGTWPAGKWVQLYWNGKLDWYYFKPDGYMATGWLLDNDRWYYLHPYADGTQGYMYKGWNQINNKWYYFNPLVGGPMGAMETDTTTPDGFYVNTDGVWE